MRSVSYLSGLATLASFASTVVADLDPIVISGSKFFYKTNGTQFFIKGVAYQQEAGANGTTGVSSSGSTTYSDPLANAARCKIDIPLMKKLGTNTIRTYAVDPTKDHSTCMQLLQDNGIYIVSDLSQPGLSINRDTPAWNDEIFERYARVVDMFANYTNVIGYFAGNEVSNAKNNTAASAYVKAAVRDTKAYIKAKGYRQAYVGYATSDDADIRENMANYFNCGDQSSAIDFWGYNIYSWCGDSSFTQSGYDQRVKEFSSYSVPSFFAEYGCNEVTPRKFTEVGAIYGSQMTPVFSGGIVYMWFQEANNYGLVNVDSSGAATPRADYTYLSSQLAKATPTGVNKASYSPTNSAAACPSIVKGTWDAASSPLPPTPNTQLCKCMVSSLSCVVKGTVKDTAYGTLFAQVCGYGGGAACGGVSGDTDKGKYGAYSMCSPAEQLSFAFDQYYKSQNSNADACNFNGAAQVQRATSATGQCATWMSQAGAAGTGIVSSNPIGAAAGTGSASASGTKKSSASTVVPAFDFAGMFVVVYASFAALCGAGMLLL